MDFLNFLSSDNLAVVILLLISGLALVLIGAEVLVDGSSKIAKKLGISDFVIGLSIVAIGTSAPEMVVSFLGAIQGKADISVGNIVGSNVFNTAFVLGISALIAPVLITRTNKRRDVPVNLVVTLLLFLCGMTGTLLALVGLGDSGFASNTISRVEGAVFLLLFIGYMVWSFLSSEKSAEDVQDPAKAKQINVWISLIFIILGIVSLVFGGQVFVSSAEAIAHKAGLSDKFIAVTVLACGTSLPELATSVVAAIKGKGHRQRTRFQCRKHTAHRRRLGSHTSALARRHQPPRLRSPRSPRPHADCSRLPQSRKTRPHGRRNTARNRRRLQRFPNSNNLIFKYIHIYT